MAGLGESGQFRSAVNGSHLCGIGNINHFRLYHVLKAVVVNMGFVSLCYLRCRDLTVRTGQSQYLMSAGFHRTGLMDIDMSCDSAKHALVLAKCCIDHGDIGLGSAYQEMDCQTVIPTGLTDLLARLFAVFILAVARCLLHIGLHQTL